MARAASRAEFVSAVAEEISSGIQRAVNYWLGRIELEVLDESLSSGERIYAIERIIHEYKEASEGHVVGCASA
jgi:hypothetical protein